jgi:hypothetical protein
MFWPIGLGRGFLTGTGLASWLVTCCSASLIDV